MVLDNKKKNYFSNFFFNDWLIFFQNGSGVISCCSINEVMTYIYDLVKFYRTRNFATTSQAIMEEKIAHRVEK